MFFWRQLKETLQALKLMNGFTMSTSERCNETRMSFRPKNVGCTAAPTQHLVCCYIVYQKKARRNHQKSFHGSRVKKWILSGSGGITYSNTQHGKLFSLSRNIKFGLGKKNNQNPHQKATTTRATKTNDTKKMVKKLSDVHWNWHTPTGKTVLSWIHLPN